MDLTFQKGSDGSTFGGYPPACVAGVSALEVLENENLAKRSAIQGKELKQYLMKIAAHSEDIKEVRGKGLFIGIEVKHGNAMKFCRKLLEMGIIVNNSHGHTIRISPPLNINESEIGFLVEGLEKVFRQ
jgi:ornithine--oxo-acid transaminase